MIVLCEGLWGKVCSSCSGIAPQKTPSRLTSATLVQDINLNIVENMIENFFLPATWFFSTQFLLSIECGLGREQYEMLCLSRIGF